MPYGRWASHRSPGVFRILTFTDWELHYGGPPEISDYQGRRQGIAMAVESLEKLDAWELIFGVSAC